MPFTVNGIGTHYYGKSNLLQRSGQCDQCGRPAELSSYDTRLWWVVLFIPIIPLGKKHIIDACPHCRRHRVMSASDWVKALRKSRGDAMRRVVENPGDAQAAVELHRTLLLFGEWIDADLVAARLEQEFPDDAKVRLYLASAHAYRGRVAEAQASLARARQLDPSIEATPATSETTSTPNRRGSRGRRAAVLFGIIGVVALVLLIFADRHAAAHRILHIANGFSEPVQVAIEGISDQQVGPLSHAEIELPEGDYTARVRGAVSTETPFSISSHLFARIFDSRVFVLNPGGMAVLVQEEAVYTTKPADARSDGGRFSVHYGQPFEAFDSIDYPFKEFPREVKIEHGHQALKQRLYQYRDSPLDVFFYLVNAHRTKQAIAFAEWGIDTHPLKADFLSGYATLGVDPVQRERVIAKLKVLAAMRPVEISTHRVYQDLFRGPGRDALLPEYDALLKADPGSSALIYLRGRLSHSLKEAGEYFESALRADDRNAYAHFALGFGHSSRGQWNDAQASIERACALDPSNAQFREELYEVRMGLGDRAALEKDLQEEALGSRLNVSAASRLVSLVALRGNGPHALELCEKIRTAHAGSDAAGAARLHGFLRLQALYASQDFSELEAEAAKVEDDSTTGYRIQALIEQGRLDDAAAIAPQNDADPFLPLIQSIAWSLKGEPDKAAALRKVAVDRLKAGDPDLLPAAAMLSGSKAPSIEEALDLSAVSVHKAILLTAIAQAFPDAPSEFREKAAGLNVSPAFPHHLLARALAELGKRR